MPPEPFTIHDLVPSGRFASKRKSWRPRPRTVAVPVTCCPAQKYVILPVPVKSRMAEIACAPPAAAKHCCSVLGTAGRYKKYKSASDKRPEPTGTHRCTPSVVKWEHFYSFYKYLSIKIST